jgi:cytochrome oxidase Cu insertion factor (SCO1/SenC/PrrC family)
VKDKPSVGKVAIGGLFNLVNHEGKHVIGRDFMEKWTSIYFGSTHYIDICLDEI